MNPEVKSKWIAALKSGNYTQAKRMLRDTNSFCCLGVLCDLYHKETGLGKWEFNGDFSTETQTQNKVPPNEVTDWAGLFATNPGIKDKNGFDTNLAKANDDGASFEELANYIEEQK